MKRLILAVFLTGGLACPILVGCDRTVSEESRVEKRSDGTVVTEKEKTTESPDGSKTKTTEKTVDR